MSRYGSPAIKAVSTAGRSGWEQTVQVRGISARLADWAGMGVKPALLIIEQIDVAFRALG